MVLLMSCANLAGMLLARAASRRKEIAVRLSLGAGRLRLVRQLLIEGALLSAGGALAGLVLAFWGVRALLAMLARGLYGIAFEVRPDARLLAFTGAVSLLTTLLFGLAPALRATRQDLASEVKADTPLTGGHGFRSVGALLAVQIAVALILLAGATLFTRSLANLRAIPLGLNPQKLVMFGLTPGANGYDESRGNRLYSNLLDRLKRIPGVTGVTLSVQTPLSGLSWTDRVRIDGGDSPNGQTLNLNFVGPEFFEVMQIPILLGRGIDRRDSATSPKVAVISESTAREFFGTGSPLGRKFRWSEQPALEVEVVGVVKDAKYDHLQKKLGAVGYIPYQQNRNGWSAQVEYELRTAGDPVTVIGAAHAAVGEFDRMLPLLEVKTMEAQIDDALAQQRLFASLVSLFGTMTLVLACVGLYGLVSYSVASRTREIGVRMALGAGRMAVLRMLMGQVAVTTAAGLAVGLPAARALTRLIESQLYGIHANDALSLAVAAVAVVLVALLAAVIPARRAMRIDPLRALRYE
jgi:predicted permease